MDVVALGQATARYVSYREEFGEFNLTRLVCVEGSQLLGDLIKGHGFTTGLAGFKELMRVDGATVVYVTTRYTCVGREG